MPTRRILSVIELVIVAAAALALYIDHLAGVWRGIYDVAIVLSVIQRLSCGYAGIPEHRLSACAHADRKGAAVSDHPTNGAGTVRGGRCDRPQTIPQTPAQRADLTGSSANLGFSRFHRLGGACRGSLQRTGAQHEDIPTVSHDSNINGVGNHADNSPR